MDKNQITGLLLIFLMLSIYFQFFAPNPTPQNNKTKTQKIKPDPFTQRQLETQKLQDSASAAKMLGDFATFVKGTSQDVVLENENISITLTTNGGKVKQVILKNYKTFDGKKLVLLDEKSSTMSLNIPTADGKNVDLYQLYFTPSNPSKSAKSVRFRLAFSENKFIEQIYTLSDKGFQLDYQLNIKGFEKEISTKQMARLNWLDNLKRLEADLTQSRYYTTINYSTAEGDFNYLTWPSDEKIEQPLSDKVHWISFKQKFFASSLIAKNRNFQNAILTKSTDLKNDQIEQTHQAEMTLSTLDLMKGKGDFQFYFGPTRYYNLSDTKIENFGKNVYLGWSFIALVSRYVVVPLFAILEQTVQNYGLIIILMVIIIKTLLLPLTYSSYKAMAKMKVLNDLLKPELDTFKEKNGLNKSFLSMEEQQKVNQEQMRLYGELGSSPFAAMSGCIPLLLQMPILFAMFMFFPSAIELRQEGFLWAHDLSTYDSILRLPFHIPGFGSHISLFTLLMTLSTIALTYYTNQNQPNMNAQMKYMGYILPVVFMFVLNSYPAGLSFYYLVQNLVSMGQQQAIKKFFIDEQKIKAKFEDYKKDSKNKDKKKQTFTEKLIELQKKQQEQMEAKKMKNKKPDTDNKKKQ